MRKASAHLSEEQLARLQDGELSGAEAGHLESCQECAARLRVLNTGIAAYQEYRDGIRGPMLPPAPQPWPMLGTLISHQESSAAGRWFRWWQIPIFAAAAAALLMLVWYRPSEQRVTRLLAESARAPRAERRHAALRVQGHRLTPADEPRWRAVFARARYDWDDPLSARAFQSWRGGLPEKQDFVSLTADREAYVVRTDTRAGILRSASLTLRGKDLRPTNGLLRFEGEGDVELAEAPPETPVEPRDTARRAPPAVDAPPAETPATPEDTLRVLDALNRMGADVSEPIEVTEDPNHRKVIVRASGLSPSRQQEIADRLRAFPHVAVEFDAAGSGSRPSAAKSTPEQYSASIPERIRQLLEQKLGGPVAVQQVTDDVIEASASVLARSHAVEVLAEKFPPETAARLSPQGQAMLRDLRERHFAALAESSSKIRGELKPLLAGTTHTPPAALVSAARDLDQLLNRLLAGSYSEATGQEMLSNLGARLDALDSAIQQQRMERR